MKLRFFTWLTATLLFVTTNLLAAPAFTPVISLGEFSANGESLPQEARGSVLTIYEADNFKYGSNWNGAPKTNEISFLITSNDALASISIDGVGYGFTGVGLAGFPTQLTLYYGYLNNPTVTDLGGGNFRVTIYYTQTMPISSDEVLEGESIDFVASSTNGAAGGAILKIDITPVPCPPVSVWLGGASGAEQDWHTASNWSPRLVPQSCTDVYIPGISVNGQSTYRFPDLDTEPVAGIDNNTCDRIFFMPGGQLGRPDLLEYNDAHVEINYNGNSSLTSQATMTYTALLAKVSNETTGREVPITYQDRVRFGAGCSGTTLARGYWHMLSAPLQEVVTGDLAFGGFPFSYIKKYDATVGSDSFIRGSWADYDSQADYGFAPGQGFGHYYFPYMANTPYGMDNSAGSTQWNAAKAYTNNGIPVATATPASKSGEAFGLAQSNSIVHLPYFSDSYLSNARRAHEYSGTEYSGTSTFSFFWQAPMTSTSFMQWTGGSETFARSEKAYRFIFDGWDGEYTPDGSFKKGDVLLVGNPYMSALDFSAFQSHEDNSQVIKKVYHIYKSSGGNYYTYDMDGSVTANGAVNEIAPMQSFLVEIADGVNGSISLKFDAETMLTTTTAAMLKAPKEATATNRLSITVSNTNGTSSAWLRQSVEANDDFCNEDYSKIIDNPNSSPAVYTLTTTKESALRALLLNSIRTNQVTVPLGVTSTYSGNMTLTVSGMDNYDACIFFIDATDNSETEITGRADYSYSYTHEGSKASSLEDRFFLRFSPAPTSLDYSDAANSVTAYAQGADLIVLSSDDNRINEVLIYDLQGHLKACQTLSGVSLCKMESIFSDSGVYLVKIRTTQGAKSIKVIR